MYKKHFITIILDQILIIVVLYGGIVPREILIACQNYKR